MNVPWRLYHLLHQHFGTQGWWPTTPYKKTEPVYHPEPKVHNLSEPEKFEICAGAILTQNTAWTNVTKALIQLHKNRALSAKKIVQVPFPTLAQWIRSSGYFRQKAKKLKIFARYLISKYDGQVGLLLKQPASVVREELLQLHGMGPETVDSILLYAGGHPIFVVDAYTKRIGNRVGLFKTEDYAKVQDYFQKELPKSVSLYNEYHALLVALGKNVCKTKPLCEICPLNKMCRYANKSLSSGASVIE